MDNVFQISTEKHFTLDEANKYVDLLLTVTQKSKVRIQNLNARIDYLKGQSSETLDELQSEINKTVTTWSQKVKKLGLVPLSLWRVKFPGPPDYHLIWEFPHDHVMIHYKAKANRPPENHNQ